METNNPFEEIEVTVSLSLSKSFKIPVNDYTVLEDGTKDYSTCNLKKAVVEHVILPHNAYSFLFMKKPSEDLRDWNVDEFEVIKE